MLRPLTWLSWTCFKINQIPLLTLCGRWTQTFECETWQPMLCMLSPTTAPAILQSIVMVRLDLLQDQSDPTAQAVRQVKSNIWMWDEANHAVHAQPHNCTSYAVAIDLVKLDMLQDQTDATAQAVRQVRHRIWKWDKAKHAVHALLTTAPAMLRPLTWSSWSCCKISQTPCSGRTTSDLSEIEQTKQTCIVCQKV